MYKLDRHIINLSTFIEKLDFLYCDFITVVLSGDGILISLDASVYNNDNNVFIPRTSNGIEIVGNIDSQIERFSLIIKGNQYSKVHLTNINAVELYVYDSYKYLRLNSCYFSRVYLHGYIHRLSVSKTNIKQCIGSYVNILRLCSTYSIDEFSLNKLNKIKFNKRSSTANKMMLYCSDIEEMYTLSMNILDIVRPTRYVVSAPFTIEDISDIDHSIVAYIISLGL